METRPRKSAEKFIKDIRRKTRIHPNVFCKWSKEFLEAGRKRLAGDTVREASSGEVEDLRKEDQALKILVADQALSMEILRKNLAQLD